ncbi:MULTISPECIES: endo alpha-1,4 polygalactosaminidase [unclassified Mucilaginibacter]|uniref:endo alpha-1,4 polygalactosaminidase n=1 Tax=unclassified Mucilaginibacter TaxID=2617802 RepID=UPI002AC8DE35|nr:MULTISPECIES: endo alpha-1,4 polygalactosaminidase [unclassified Mucilaginibacter]MEB0260687.1 endo alpha-1,4 polygalactosaminidase [Mucilaginibacter sp. 10I4]MEB0277428.1 endo alpha-1,4 polygalactosaminidase [Mucilaginibacter sp. 10B2]MEB0300947.1 endo alpha-1,4 polygalactosaminidase [Mucilaginibacter sp. 5C4]WPX24942.1 endo alpha-1,4 polygalactosaminidase [Mucilaginibacter sp. 5C4]
MTYQKSILILGVSLVFFVACKKNNDADPPINSIDSLKPAGGKTSWWQPVAGASFDWQLDAINSTSNFSADVVDVDAFNTSAETVAALQAKGKKVIAYLSVGTLENYRNDASLLPPEVIGKQYPEWPQEKWLDIRQIDKLKPWLNSRFNMIIKKGFDGVEPDNMDGYDNDPGFNIQLADTKKYADYLITLAHSNGLSIGQKNIKELTVDFAAKFDWALTEDAFAQGWQNQLSDYIKLNKPVFAVEYTDLMSQSKFQANVCLAARQLKYTAILKKRDLSQWVDRCN